MNFSNFKLGSRMAIGAAFFVVVALTRRQWAFSP